MRQREIDRHRRTLAYAREQVAEALDTLDPPPEAVAMIPAAQASLDHYERLVWEAEQEYQARRRPTRKVSP